VNRFSIDVDAATPGDIARRLEKVGRDVSD
jgi:hypothetical protein